MSDLFSVIGRTLLVLIGSLSEKKQEPRIWNRYAEFSYVISKDSFSSRELVFTKDSVNLIIKDEKETKKISCAFSEKHQTLLITSLEKNKFFHLPSCGKNKTDSLKIVLTYTKDHFRKQVCYPSGKKDGARLDKILNDIYTIADELNWTSLLKNPAPRE